jgi:hypothetical protein
MLAWLRENDVAGLAQTARSRTGVLFTTENRMKKTSRVYVLTVQPLSRRGLRLWTGKSVHALRHCSTKQMSQVLAEMQQSVDERHAPIRKSTPDRSYSINRSR